MVALHACHGFVNFGVQTPDIHDMFIVSDKYYCSNNTFTDVRVTSLLAKNV